ncbi:dipeptide epimerase [Streptomyces sp. SS]|uniref:dipeptide epimerase n=1 Tax=Streptomyces sp. SS TaxID=260742 RepID=UPI0002F9AF61|nr:dipeptide epimerase [Streptomyces sp. SS]
MRITDLVVHHRQVPLRMPYSSVIRGTVDEAHVTLVELVLEDGSSAWGEAVSMPAVTGETPGSVVAALNGPLRAAVVGRRTENLEETCDRVERSILGNGGAKAGVDIALHDAFARGLGTPLHRALGGGHGTMETSITVGLGTPDEMALRATELVKDGFTALKLKVGHAIAHDVQRVEAVRQAVGPDIRLRLDANQGWTAKESVHAVRLLEDRGADIELIEQPVPARDLRGLRFVRERVSTPVVADESVLTPQDALEVVRQEAADVLSIKVQKSGGVRGVLRIISIAEAAGLTCMIGCSLETEISITAAASVVAARTAVTHVDLDAPLWLGASPVRGGVSYRGPVLELPDAPGLGVDGVLPVPEPSA